MRYLLIVFFMIMINNSYGQEDSTKVKGVSKTVAELAKEIDYEVKYWEDENQALNGYIIDQFERYKYLKDIATNEELILLTEISSPVVQAYAFRALMERNQPVVFDILLRNLQNYSLLEYAFFRSNRFEMSEMVYLGDFFYSLLQSSSNKAYHLTDTQQEFLEFNLFHDKESKLKSRLQILSTIKPDSIYYASLKEFYLRDSIPEALVGLARFQKEEDLFFIKKLFESSESKDNALGVRALKEYPNPSLFNQLKKIHLGHLISNDIDTAWVNVVYDCLIAYNTTESLELIKLSIEEVKNYPRKYHFYRIYCALDPSYLDPLVSYFNYPNFLYSKKALLEKLLALPVKDE